MLRVRNIIKPNNNPNNPIQRKSPHELAAQILSIYGTDFAYKNHPSGGELDTRYKDMRRRVEQMLTDGINDDDLMAQLNKIYEEGTWLGIFSPLSSPRSTEFIDGVKGLYFARGYDEQIATRMAKNELRKRGYVAELRRWRRSYEKDIERIFSEQYSALPLDKETEYKRILELRKKCIYVGRESSDVLSADFDDGNFLYHGTKIKAAIAILNSGQLLNTKALWEREQQKAEAEGRRPNAIKHNSGYEGISWSFNEITALPGDRYHLVGFLASPNTI